MNIQATYQDYDDFFSHEEDTDHEIPAEWQVRRTQTPAFSFATTWSSSPPMEAHDPDAELRQKLALRRFSLASPPEEPVPILTLAGETILTPGNLANIQAQAKAGKTAVLGGMLAAVLSKTRPISDISNLSGDFLGFCGPEEAGKFILYIDTEQSRFDHHSCVCRILRRAGLQDAPPNFLSYSLVDVSVAERRRGLQLLLEERSRAYDGVLLLAIDGVGDLLMDSNDLAGSCELVDWLHTLAVTYECGIVTVLHENPGEGNSKPRGHLGSQLERKVESNIIVRKGTDGISSTWCDRGRHCHIPKSRAHKFQYDQDRQMHVSVDPATIPLQQEIVAHEAFSVLRQIAEMPVRYGRLTEEIVRIANVSERTAKSRISQWQELNIVTKSSDGRYSWAVQGATGAEPVQNA